MATAEREKAPPNRFRKVWLGFRRWRRARPFAGGLVTALAGLEFAGTTQMSFAALSLQMGPTGLLSWLVPAILLTCGALMWFSPQQRIFYAVVAAVTALFALIAVNLGGFFLGSALGAVGSALAFAWVPGPRRPSQPRSESAVDGPGGRRDSAGGQPAWDGPADAQPVHGESTVEASAEPPAPDGDRGTRSGSRESRNGR
ncbi:DUF6114 domain-containing protein [Micromonospora sp. MS34]|uniref:DUF6114 domain-containing protein n=1 Tax=Micromonospora sp. MS34 TaxID=3385971 RepID=UPI0039A1A125